MNASWRTFDAIQTTCVCEGTGAYVVASKVKGCDVLVSGYSTEPCVCRKNLPAREGKATWWTKETVFSETAIALVDEVRVSVQPEVPMSDDNHRVQRRGNRYYPTFVDFEVGRERAILFPDEARKLAQLLVRAADAADLIDHADVDACGHWAPCDCGKVKATA
ncbi:MAG: hypothetical protein Q8T13_23775 [Acidobacteriota bacterium]|nr:hypothetical protein [Acidobacteriota bacterium]